MNAATTPLPLAWPYALVFWPVYVWVFIPEMRLMRRTPMRRDVPAEDAGSLRVVLVGFSGATCLAWLLALTCRWATLPGNPVAWFGLGLVALVSGSLLRRHCFRVLDRFFTGAVTIQAEHRVVDTGAYRWVRHPSYTAALAVILGIALCLGNWIGLVVSVPLAFFAYRHRARVEERALLASLGTPYAQFMAGRKRFIPYVL